MQGKIALPDLRLTGNFNYEKKETRASNYMDCFYIAATFKK